MRATSLVIVLAVAGCGSPSASSTQGALGTCTGQCAPLQGPLSRVMLWSGPEGATPPPCPDVADANRATGYLDTPPSTVTCSTACTCSPSQNTCFPAGTMVANGAVCPATGTGVQHTPFDAPDVWDGTCTAMDPVSSAESLTVDPPQLPYSGSCAPAGVGVTAFTGGPTIAIACNALGDIPGACPDLDQVCTYPNVQGFSVCTVDAPDAACAEGWPIKHMLFEESQSCSCSCGDPMGESCSTTVTAYEDSTCQDSLASVTATSSQPAACVDIAPASALGSKSASVIYKPGTCTPMLQMINTYTLCCLP